MFLIKIIGQTWEVLVEFLCVILYMKEDIFSLLDTFLSEIYKNSAEATKRCVLLTEMLL